MWDKRVGEVIERGGWLCSEKCGGAKSPPPLPS